MPAVVSKRGVDDGNQKGGSSPQPAKESHEYYNIKSQVEKKRGSGFSRREIFLFIEAGGGRVFSLAS